MHRGRPRRPPRTAPSEIEHAGERRRAEAEEHWPAVRAEARASYPRSEAELSELVTREALPIAPQWALDALGASLSPRPDGKCPCCGKPAADLTARVRPRGLEAARRHYNCQLDLIKLVCNTDPPPPEVYGEIYMKLLVPAYNVVHFESRLCIECGNVFSLRTRKDIDSSRYCSDPCRARIHNRGRDKAHGGRSAAEAKATRAGERLSRHMARCGRCKSGRDCSTRERLLVTDMSSPPIRFESDRRKRR